MSGIEFVVIFSGVVVVGLAVANWVGLSSVNPEPQAADKE